MRRLRLHGTSSALPRLLRCPPSDALARTDEENDRQIAGSCGHEHMHQRAELGVDEAMRELPALCKRWGLDERETTFLSARLRNFEWVPPAHSIGELALALFEDGRVERTTGGRGRYPELDPGGRLEGALLAGQLDVMWSEPEPLDLSDPAHPRCPRGSALYVADYKFGFDAHVDPVEVNLQAHANAVMAARWTGARFVVPVVLFVKPPQGDWDSPAVAWGPREIAVAEARVRATLAKRREQIDRLVAGDELDGFVEGEWCTFCPGKLSCPAKVSMMRRTADLAVVKAPFELTDEEAAWWALRITQIEGHVNRAREYLKARVDETGKNIDLGNGLEWGPVPAPTSRILAHVALPILDAEIGASKLDDVARISRKSIESAVREMHAQHGIKRQLSKTMGRIMSQIKDAGGLLKEEGEQYKAHRPSAELDEGPDDDGLGAESAA
jgi:hypothetical protein